MKKYLHVFCCCLVLTIGNAQRNYFPYCDNDIYVRYREELKKEEKRISDEIKLKWKKEKIIQDDLKRKDKFLKDNPIKAVIIVGPVEEKTKGFIERMKKTEEFLKSKHVEIHAFYFPNTNWEDIKKAANDASIFIYSGHGGYESILPGVSVSHEMIVKDIKLRKNALVIMNHTCYAAGSSASDFGADIGIEEAENRVSQYARTFFKAGAGCYYADNYYFAALRFLENFYDENNIKQCYEIEISFYNTIEKYDLSSFDVNLCTGISSKTDEYGLKYYCIAFVAKPDYNLKNLLARKKQSI
jgi:hypothetical protein